MTERKALVSATVYVKKPREIAGLFLRFADGLALLLLAALLTTLLTTLLTALARVLGLLTVVTRRAGRPAAVGFCRSDCWP